MLGTGVELSECGSQDVRKLGEVGERWDKSISWEDFSLKSWNGVAYSLVGICGKCIVNLFCSKCGGRRERGKEKKKEGGVKEGDNGRGVSISYLPPRYCNKCLQLP